MRCWCVVAMFGLWAWAAQPEQPRPATLPVAQPAEGKLPYLQVDAKNKQVRMECQAVNAELALEYLVCVAGTSEHETVLRSNAKPSHVHLALLMIGLEPGEPLRFSQSDRRWLPPRGPKLKINCEFVKDGRSLSVPAHQMMRNLKTKKPLPPTTWVFAGSRLMEDGVYAADITGHLISVVNFEHATVDIAELRSSNNELLEWEVNPEAVPKRQTTVWVVIEPAEGK